MFALPSALRGSIHPNRSVPDVVNPAQEALGPASTAAQLAIAARAYPKTLLVKTGQTARSKARCHIWDLCQL